MNDFVNTRLGIPLFRFFYGINLDPFLAPLVTPFSFKKWVFIKKQNNISRQVLTFFVIWVEVGDKACLIVNLESRLTLDLQIALPKTGWHT